LYLILLLTTFNTLLIGAFVVVVVVVRLHVVTYKMVEPEPSIFVYRGLWVEPSI